MPGALPYRGRFAPTPSGPLHPGSLLTALASYLQARTSAGAWLLRIDDLDPLRSAESHRDTQLRQLEAHGLCWDETPRLQSQHLEEYEATFQRLQQSELIFSCSCTRAQLARDSLPGCDGSVYAGTCRGQRQPVPHCAWRLCCGVGELRMADPWQGLLQRELSRDIGDFTVKRADGIIGYQLACVVDETAQGITEVVRGADLIGSSFRQIRLQQLLGLPSPAYRHLPVLADLDGHKLSKQNHAAPISAERAGYNLHRCLSLLGQSPPPGLQRADAAENLGWSLAHWDSGRVPSGLQLKLDGF